jgi:RHS repeat-associated protein
VYKFTGKELDSETGLYYLGARYYSPVDGIFLSVDVLSGAPNNIGWNPYHYTWNNPVKFIDPTGMHGESTHVDEVGNVIAEYDDGDNGVYVHANGTTKSQIDVQRGGGAYTGGDGNYIGELGGTIDVNQVYSNLLERNIGEAKKIRNPWTFKNLVTDKGDWDLKADKESIFGLGNDGRTKFSFEGEMLEAQDIGNHHFGAVALAVGLFPDEEFILRQAGKNQMSKPGLSKPEWQKYKTYEVSGNWKTESSPRTIRIMLPPYGDDPRDQKWIKSGFEYYKRR